jgi:DnaJ-class molecular chaperone
MTCGDEMSDIDRKIEEAFEDHIEIFTDGRRLTINREDLHKKTFAAGAKWAMEYVKKEQRRCPVSMPKGVDDCFRCEGEGTVPSDNSGAWIKFGETQTCPDCKGTGIIAPSRA